MEGDRPVSRWLLTPCKSVLLHRRRELVPGSDVLGRAGDGRGWSHGCGLGWGSGVVLGAYLSKRCASVDQPASCPRQTSHTRPSLTTRRTLLHPPRPQAQPLKDHTHVPVSQSIDKRLHKATSPHRHVDGELGPRVHLQAPHHHRRPIGPFGAHQQIRRLSSHGRQIQRLIPIFYIVKGHMQVAAECALERTPAC